MNKSIKILIADDTSNNRLLIKTMLKTFGYKNVTEVENGMGAIDKVQSNDYDLIFMDIQMPKIDGIVATQYIRNTLKRTMMIVGITAYDYIKAEENGFDLIIRKPYPMEEIKQVIEKFI